MKSSLSFAAFLAIAGLVTGSMAAGQERAARQRIDVVNYTIVAEVAPAAQTIAASANFGKWNWRDKSST